MTLTLERQHAGPSLRMFSSLGEAERGLFAKASTVNEFNSVQRY